MQNPKVYFDMSVGGAPARRVEMELFADVTSKTAENFKSTGELGVGKSVASEVMKVDEIWFPVSIPPKPSSYLCLLGYGGNGDSREIQAMWDEFPFPTIRPIESHPLLLVGHGITEISILFFLKIKFTAIRVYLNPEVASHLQKWKGKSGAQIFAEDIFFDILCEAPVDKFIGVVILKELKGAQYGLNIEMKDRLAVTGEFEEGEKEGLEKLVEFFEEKYLNDKSLITFNFPATNKTVEVSLFPVEQKKESANAVVENEKVAAMVLKYYMGGSSAISKTLITSLADGMAALLSQ